MDLVLSTGSDLRNVTDFYINFLGPWNGTGTCATEHHGEMDCYGDLFHLCGRAATRRREEDTRYVDFSNCLFHSQQDLCANTWDDDTQACGYSSWSEVSAYFPPVVSACAESAGFTDDETAAMDRCALDPSTNTMAAAGRALLVADFQIATAHDVETPVWVLVNGSLVDSTDKDADTWAAELTAAICAAYQGETPSCSTA